MVQGNGLPGKKGCRNLLPGTSKTDTVCEHCAEGYFSNSSSAEDPCVKQRECASGQNVLLRGSVYHDAVCGTCEDLASQGQFLEKIVFSPAIYEG